MLTLSLSLYIYIYIKIKDKDMCLPAGMYWKIFGVVGVLLILLKVQLCQQLTGFHHGIVSIL